MAAVNYQQIKKIYAISNALGIVERSNGHEDDLHALVAVVTGKASLKELAYGEAEAVIEELRKRQGGYQPTERRQTPPQRSTRHEELPGGVTEGQQRKIWRLMYELRALDNGAERAALGERLCGVIRKELKMDSTPERPFCWMNYRAGNKLIEVLKNYIKSAKKKVVVSE